MQEEQYTIDTSFDNTFGKLINKYLPQITDIQEQVKQEKKPKYEFIELCQELEPIYGKQIWSLPRRIGYTEYKIREAHKRCMEKGIVNIRYLVGIIKNM